MGLWAEGLDAAAGQLVQLADVALFQPVALQQHRVLQAQHLVDQRQAPSGQGRGPLFG